MCTHVHSCEPVWVEEVGYGDRTQAGVGAAIVTLQLVTRAHCPSAVLTPRLISDAPATLRGWRSAVFI